MRLVSLAKPFYEVRSSCRRSTRGSFAPCILTAAIIAALSATSAFAQASASGSNWDHLKALPAGTRMHVSGDKMSHTCTLASVDDAGLVCGKNTFPRAEVKQVKLTRYVASYAVGAAVGGGAGAGIGLAVIRGTIVESDKGKGAAIGLALGAVVGALVTGPADLFRGPTVYRR